jgi:two-component system, OmpR family, sensor histidine kinase KdpD
MSSANYFLSESLWVAGYPTHLEMSHLYGTRRLLRSAATIPVVALITAVAYQCHAKPLTAGILNLALIMLVAFRWGFAEGVLISIAAAACLDFFYMPPIFSLYEKDPQDWISSFIFVAIALLVSRFANHLSKQALDTSMERARLERLYLTSRDILLMDRQQDVGTQLASLIESIFKVDGVAVWDAREPRMEKAGQKIIADDEIRAIYFHEQVENDPTSLEFKRILRIGVRPIGALFIAASPHNNYLDSRSVDAIASLAAIALERAHSFIEESNAKAAKRSEQLRSTILDGLAHAFKSPLVTIHTASGGLLEIPQLGPAGRELAALIEEEAERLTDLTSKVLQTAELDEGKMEVDEEKIELNQFLPQCREWFDQALADHPLFLVAESTVDHMWADEHLLQMALFQMLDNASKYAHSASPITLRIGSTEAEVVFSIHNEGSYIAPEERSSIFERFYRSPEAQYKASGNGIGLSVTKRIAAMHRGRVWVESDLKAGTTFFFTLPHRYKED